MFTGNKEKGYALIIVLFSIVFITTITAVFMRGALSNVAQEKTVDENNLVVVSAEAGLDYYKWELEKVYNKEEFESIFNQKVKELATQKVTPDAYNEIRKDIANDFGKKLKEKAVFLENEEKKPLFSEYYHELIRADVSNPSILSMKPEETISFVIDGLVKGETNDKDREITFQLKYEFPPVVIPESGTPDTGVDQVKPPSGANGAMPTLKEPKKPETPVTSTGIVKPANACKSKVGNLENFQDCFISEKNEASYSINKSKMYVENSLAWGNINIENSFLDIKSNLTTNNLKIEDTDLVIDGDISSYGEILFNKINMIVINTLDVKKAKIENSFIKVNDLKIGGANSRFNKTDLTVKAGFTSSGSYIENSNFEIRGILDAGNGLLTVDDSSLLVKKETIAKSGLTIKKSAVKMLENLTIAQGFLSEKSDIFIGGNLEDGNGSNLKKTNMIVVGNYTSTSGVGFNSEKSRINVQSTLNLGNGGKLKKSLLIANRIISSQILDLEKTKLYVDYLEADTLELKKSKVCAKDLTLTKFKVDGDSDIDIDIDNDMDDEGEDYDYEEKESVVYYLNSSNLKHNRIVKLSPEEFQKKCGIVNNEIPDVPETPSTPQSPGFIKWKTPVLEDVTY